MSRIKEANWDDIEDGKLDLTEDRAIKANEPTYAQLNCIYRWLMWKMPTAKARAASQYLQKNATRREVSVEMNRLKSLKDAHRLDNETAFNSEIWEGFDERFI